MTTTDTTRLLVTGSRDITDRTLVRDALDAVSDGFLLAMRKPLTLVHGGARGLDTLAGEEWTHGQTEVYPAQWNQHTPSCPEWDRGNHTCKLAGHRRNQQMLDAGADLCLAFPLHRLALPLHQRTARGKGTSRGTWDMAKLARDAGVPTLVVWGNAVFPFGQPAIDVLTREVDRGLFDFGPYQSIPLRFLILPF